MEEKAKYTSKTLRPPREDLIWKRVYDKLTLTQVEQVVEALENITEISPDGYGELHIIIRKSKPRFYRIVIDREFISPVKGTSFE
jgi:hypothetical protein